MQNLFTFFITITLIIIGMSVGNFVTNSVGAISPDLLNNNYTFGPLGGISQSNNGSIDWVMVGNWRMATTNNSERDTNTDVRDVHENQNKNSFNAAIEMMKPDGTFRHTHSITDFTPTDIYQSSENSTVFNGTSTISLRDGPAIDIPTSIQKSTNNQVFVINIDPKSVKYHFGQSPLIYGISVNNNHFGNATANNPAPTNLKVY